MTFRKLVSILLLALSLLALAGPALAAEPGAGGAEPDFATVEN